MAILSSLKSFIAVSYKGMAKGLIYGALVYAPVFIVIGVTIL